MVLFVCALILAAQLGVYNVFELYYSDEAILSEEAKGELVPHHMYDYMNDYVYNRIYNY